VYPDGSNFSWIQIRKIILLNYQNKYLTLKLVARISKFFAALFIIFKLPTNYFDGLTKLFSALYPAKF